MRGIGWRRERGNNRFLKDVGERSDRIWWLDYLEWRREEENPKVTHRFSDGRVGDGGELGRGGNSRVPSVPEARSERARACAQRG